MKGEEGERTTEVEEWDEGKGILVEGEQWRGSGLSALGRRRKRGGLAARREEREGNNRLWLRIEVEIKVNKT